MSHNSGISQWRSAGPLMIDDLRTAFGNHEHVFYTDTAHTVFTFQTFDGDHHPRFEHLWMLEGPLPIYHRRIVKVMQPETMPDLYGQNLQFIFVALCAGGWEMYGSICCISTRFDAINDRVEPCPHLIMPALFLCRRLATHYEAAVETRVVTEVLAPA